MKLEDSSSCVTQKGADEAMHYLLERPKDDLKFFVNGKKIIEKNADPETTLLTYLRRTLSLTGTKLGCGEGGCGACTVMVSKWNREKNEIDHFSINACLASVVSVDGCAVTTVEGIGSTSTKLHAVQERMSKFHGSQCGFCTPGIVMAMYALLRNNSVPSEEEIERSTQGNLCRCTGYRPIHSAFNTFTDPCSGCARESKSCEKNNIEKDQCVEVDVEECNDPHSSGKVCFERYNPVDDVLFPMEIKNHQFQPAKFVGERTTCYRPTTLNQLTWLKERFPDAQIVNGNTEVGVELGVKGTCYPVVILATAVAELQSVVVGSKGIKIGSGCTLKQLQQSFKNLILERPQHATQCIRSMLEMLHWFAGDQIRNVAAIGGNIMTASPISDLNPILMANECVANFRLHSRGNRQVKMDQDFFTKYRATCAMEGEVLTEIEIFFNSKDEYVKAYKQSKRRDDDIAIVNSAMRVCFEEGTNKVQKFVAAFGGMAATSVMPSKTMKNMVGREWTHHLLTDYMKWISEDLPLKLNAPGGMVRYRETLAASFFYKFFIHVKNGLIERGISKVSLSDTDRQLLSGENLESRRLRLGTQTWEEVPSEQPANDAVGRPVKHVSADKHVTGEAVYIDDMPYYKGELYLCLVTSTRAHAHIVQVDISEAKTSPGFVTYVDHTDVPGSNTIVVLDEDHHVFATDKVECVGGIIGAVVADTQEHAQRAAQLVKIDYKDIFPILVTIEDAVEHDSFHGSPARIITGDADSAMHTCDHVIEGEIRMGGQEHFYLETQTCLVVPKLEDGEMEIFASSQDPTAVQKKVAHLLGIQRNKVLVRVKRIGGGFGGKETKFALLSNPVAVAAHKCRKPVRCMLTRKEDMTITGGRHPFLSKYKVGFKKNGQIVSLVNNLFSNGGNTRDLSISVLYRALQQSDNCYRIPNVSLTGRVCRTNVASNTAFRGFGSPQATFVVETWMTHVAEYLGMPVEKIRELNLYEEGNLTYYNQKIESFQAKKCWDECLQKANFSQRQKDVEEYNRKNKWSKRGICCIPLKYGVCFDHKFMHQGGALVSVYSDGSVYLSHGGTEMGQGLHTKMIQVTSRCLGIPMSRIHISETSTNTVPNTLPTAASMSSDLNGMAVKDACEKIMKRLEPLKDNFPDLNWNELVNKAFMERISLSATGYYSTPDLGKTWDVKTGKIEGKWANYFTCGAAVSEVEIDCLTGDHVVLRSDIVMDLGRSLNPVIDIGQIEGAFVQGYGLFTLEEPLHTPTGHPITVGPGAYKIPGFGDCPIEFNVYLLKGSENARAIYSSKAVGEPPLLLSSSVFFAIRNAVASARNDNSLSGYFRFDSPATAERIRMTCGDSLTQQHSYHANEAEEQKLSPWSISP